MALWEVGGREQGRGKRERGRERERERERERRGARVMISVFIYWSCRPSREPLTVINLKQLC